MATFARAPTAPVRFPCHPGLVSLLLLTLAGTAAAAGPANPVVIDFDQRGLILGWIGLWLVAAATFVACADKRIALMTRLADFLRRRAQRRADIRADAALRALARHDPRILADIRAAADHTGAHAPEIPPPWAMPAMATQAAAPRTATTPGRAPPTRGFQTAPLPGLPRHLQYLPG